jgi:peptide/nickel transport system permease protein
MASVETIETVPRRETALGTLWYFTKRYPLGAAGAVIVTLFVLMAIFAPWITQLDPTMTNSRDSLAPPGGSHPLGADFMGRDMWSRVVYGARISLAVGIGSTGLGCLFGVTIGRCSSWRW